MGTYWENRRKEAEQRELDLRKLGDTEIKDIIENMGLKNDTEHKVLFCQLEKRYAIFVKAYGNNDTWVCTTCPDRTTEEMAMKSAIKNKAFIDSGKKGNTMYL